MPLIEAVVASLGSLATLHRLHDADHAFHVRRSSGSTDDRVLDDLLDTMVAWISRIARPA